MRKDIAKCQAFSALNLRMAKRQLIKDPIWGNIELLSWERVLINHFIFNRLHNIIQNSSGYRAYPGLRSSRFSHTIGVTHVATQIFVNASVNAEGNALHALKSEADEVSKKLTFRFRESLDEFSQELSVPFACPPEFRFLLAAVRIASLIHDIGHLPCSHIFENAIDSFCFDNSSEAFPFRNEPTPEAAREASGHRDRLRTEIKNLRDKEPELKTAKLHELVGIVLAEELASQMTQKAAVQEIKHANWHGAQTMKFCAQLIMIAGEILRGQICPVSKTAISGTIDADRIDFTKRDGISSGLFQSGIDFGRLFALYTISERTGKKAGTFWITPSYRTISDVEKLLWERFQDYRYINAHHKVQLYDEIVENILVRMMIAGELNGLLMSLCSLMSSGHPNHSREREINVNNLKAVLLEFDDPWLESKIRSIYKGFVSGAGRLPTNDPAVVALFEAYIEDRSRFKAMFKSNNSFWKACEKSHVLKLLSPQRLSYEGEASRRNDLLSARRDKIQKTIEKVKFKLQEHLSSSAGCPVLIGSTRKKIRYGIQDEAEAIELGVGSMREFLRCKKYETPPFSCWYAPAEGGGDEEREKIGCKIISAIDEFLANKLSEFDRT